MENNGISNDSTIILNVSGGSDSMAMLHIMKEIQQQFMNQLDLKVINFNHKVRPESDEEVSVDLFFRETVLLTQSFVDSIY
jgi:tRNA(Ile)-lysidine synthase TilS/MesJ